MSAHLPPQATRSRSTYQGPRWRIRVCTVPCVLFSVASVLAALESPPNAFSAKYVPFAPEQQLEEEYSLDEVIYRSKGGE